MTKLEELKFALECVDEEAIEEGIGNANFIALMQEYLPTLIAAAELLKVFLEEGVPPYDDIDEGYVILDKLGM